MMWSGSCRHRRSARSYLEYLQLNIHLSQKDITGTKPFIRNLHLTKCKNMEDNISVEIPLSVADSEHGALVVDKDLRKFAVKTIRDLGYDVPILKKSFPVLNMSCASCASSTQTTLENLKGVMNATVNYANATANVEYIPTLTNPSEFKSALQSIGYDLMIEDSEDAKDALEDLNAIRYKTLKRRTLSAVVLSVPLVAIEMIFMHLPYANYIMWALATPIVFVFGQQFFAGAWKQLKHRSANMDTLVAMSTGIAYLFSVFNILYPQFWTSRGIEPHVYFEAAGVVIAFILLGKMLEEKAKGNTSSAIKKLIGLQPKTVTIIHEG